MSDLIRAIVLGIIEGITEFLPISSTGHMKLFDSLFSGKQGDPVFWDMFIVFIQIGAIAAVVVFFRDRLLELLRGRPERRLTPLEITSHASGRLIAAFNEPPPGAEPKILEYAPGDEIPPTSAQRGYTIMMILLASLPLVICYFADKWAERNLANPVLIAVVLIVGGVIMLIIELLPLNVTTRRIENITWKQALGIGCAQILAAIFPGTSRSAATIMAGLVGGLSRAAAAEFSFFLAIPAMCGACAFKLLKFLHGGHVSVQEMVLLAIGTVISFVVAWGVIAVFMAYIRRHNFIPFAIYRIIIGIVAFLVLHNAAAPLPHSPPLLPPAMISLD